MKETRRNQTGVHAALAHVIVEVQEMIGEEVLPFVVESLMNSIQVVGLNYYINF